MQKDVIYIDVEDDITGIIGKVKSSEKSIVALVPPKRIGVLQSAVNLQLLSRMAKRDNKRLVIISGNHALAGLAAAARIPVAKNLQSKPELAEIAALNVDDGEEVIDGAELPVGEHAKQSTPRSAKTSSAEGPMTKRITPAAAPAANADTPKPKVKKGMKVPNFNSFRKRFVLIGGGLLLLIAFLVWAIFFAPRATIVLSASTTDAAVNQPVTLKTDAESSAKDSVLKATSKSRRDDISVDFNASKEKNVGDKATGEVRFSSDSISLLRDDVTIPAGTELQSESGATYTTDSTVTLSIRNNSGSTVITAAKPGEKYNAADGDVSGGPDGIRARITETTSGGTDKIVKVVTDGDIAEARERAEAKIDRDAALAELQDQLGDEYIALGDSLQIDSSRLKSDTPVGQEPSGGEASYRGTVIYTLYAVKKSELKSYLEAIIKQQFDDNNQQKVYATGADDAKFNNAEKTDQGLLVQLSANGKIGPKIDETAIKEDSRGKNYGEVQANLESLNGVNNVDVKFWPFWVNTVPSDIDDISIEFKLDE